MARLQWKRSLKYLLPAIGVLLAVGFVWRHVNYIRFQSLVSDLERRGKIKTELLEVQLGAIGERFRKAWPAAMELVDQMNARFRISIVGGNLTDAELQLLSYHLGDRLLLFDQPLLTNEGMNHVGSATLLREVTLRSCSKLTDQSVERLANRHANSIEILRITDCPIGDKAIAAIGQLPNIGELQLSRLKYSNRGLQHLAGLRRLDMLSLGGIPIDDEGVGLLCKFTSRMQLYLEETKISARNVVSLREAGWKRISVRDTQRNDIKVESAKFVPSELSSDGGTIEVVIVVSHEDLMCRKVETKAGVLMVSPTSSVRTNRYSQSGSPPQRIAPNRWLVKCSIPPGSLDQDDTVWVGIGEALVNQSAEGRIEFETLAKKLSKSDFKASTP